MPSARHKSEPRVHTDVGVPSLRVALSARHQRRLYRVLQVSIAVILLVGIALRNVSVVVNAAVSLFVTALLWISFAVFFHSLGMIVLYDAVWWWDHLTHTLSGTLVAAVGYTTTRALDEYSDSVSFPAAFLWVYLFLFTVAFGVLWELLELAGRELARAFGMDPLLGVHGIEDTIYDLMFDMVGAAIVAAIGSRGLDDVVDHVASVLETDDAT
jgi:hypothetical protein